MNRPKPAELMYIEKRWQDWTIRQKITFFTVIVFVCVIMSVSFSIWAASSSLNGIKKILNQSNRCDAFVLAVDDEVICFREYIKERTPENYVAFREAADQTAESIEALPYIYSQIGGERYSLTWAVKSSYELYTAEWKALLAMPRGGRNYVQKLGEVYELQEYLRETAVELMNSTTEEANQRYQERATFLTMVHFIVLIFAILLLIYIAELSIIMYQTIVSPIMKLVEFAKRIAAEGFFVEDVKVENDDEIGELTSAVNTLKYAACEYILSSQENQKTWELLHKEEMEKLEVEKRLESMKLEVLINQVNPHFLFNTLNVIGGMAMLENAETTEKMIMSLSNLFRYNLKNSSTEASLAQELNVARDYMYIQQMRFGERLGWNIQCEINESAVIIPMFTFQPLIENAIIHGLSKKEEGGKIYIRIWDAGENICITVHDTGVGMTKETLEKLKRKITDEQISTENIGVGNVYRRFKIMYPEGQFYIYSREAKGTLIKLQIPKTSNLKSEGESTNDQNSNCR